MSWILAQYPWFNISPRASAYTFRREIVMSRTDSAAVQIPGFFAGTVRSEHEAYFVARVDLILEVEAVLQGGDSGV